MKQSINKYVYHAKKIGFLSIFVFGLISSLNSQSWAQLSLSTLEPQNLEQGQQQDFTLFGGGFGETVTVSFEGMPGTDSGVTLVGSPTIVSAADANDGRGDRITFAAQATATAAVGGRNLIVTTASESRTKYAALNIRAGSGGGNNSGGNNSGGNMGGMMTTDPGSNDSNNDRITGGLYDNLPPREDGEINVITRASPPKIEIGGQQNLWIEGRQFPPNVEVKFNITGIDAALDNNSMPYPIQVYRNTQDTGEELDGILYYARVAPDAPLGPISVTLRDPATGSTLTKENIIEIVDVGQGLIFNTTGAENIEQVSSASPVAVRAGRSVAMWVLGQGFNIDSTIEFSNPSIQSVRPSEVVIDAQNAPGFDGIRSYLQVPPTAAPGLVSVTVRNPNTTNKTGVDLFEVFPPANLEGNDTQPPMGIGGICEGDDTMQTISEIVAADPGQVYLGQETDLKVFARGLACRASFVLRGGGIEVIGDTPVYQDQVDPALRFFQLRIKVSPSATLGPRHFTILNPNGSTKTKDNLFTVTAGPNGAGAACQNTEGPHSFYTLLVLLLSLLFFKQKSKVLAK